MPCDPTWPAERTVSILAEAKASVVVTDAGEAEGLATALFAAACPCQVVVALDERCAVSDVLLSKRVSGNALFPLRDEAKRAMSAADGEGTRRCWSPPEVMYIMYTSGSTGKPKGCIVPTAGVWHRFGWGTKLLGMKADDVFVLKTPSTFDCSIPEMWVPI